MKKENTGGTWIWFTFGVIVIIVFMVTLYCFDKGAEEKKEFCKSLGYEHLASEGRNNLYYCYNANEGEIEKYYFKSEDVPKM